MTRQHEVAVVTGTLGLPGTMTMPDDPQGVVVFAHGSGSSRLSVRNRFVADVLVGGGLGTLLFDLLTGVEARDRANVFDLELLTKRLADATTWLRNELETQLPIGYFGASTGAAAALSAAAADRAVAAVVSRGGRPDLAGEALAGVTAPTLLIVGSHDPVVLQLNQQALAAMRCEAELSVIPGAGHLFEEPGTLAQAADMAKAWFVRWLGDATD